MSQVGLSGLKVEFNSNCKRCYFYSYYGDACLSALRHNPTNPTLCESFQIIDGTWREALDRQGFGSCLVKRLGYWEWQDDS